MARTGRLLATADNVQTRSDDVLGLAALDKVVLPAGQASEDTRGSVATCTASMKSR